MSKEFPEFSFLYFRVYGGAASASKQRNNQPLWFSFDSRNKLVIRSRLRNSVSKLSGLLFAERIVVGLSDEFYLLVQRILQA